MKVGTTLVLFGLLACERRSESIRPKTTYFARYSDVFRTFSGELRGEASFTDHALDAWTRHEYLFRELTTPRLPFAHVELRGRQGDHANFPVCNLRIGPDVLAEPVRSYAFVGEWFEDAALGKRVVDVIGKPAPLRDFELDTQVEGLAISVRSSHGYFVVEINGCDRVPQDFAERRVEGQVENVFPGHGVGSDAK